MPESHGASGGEAGVFWRAEARRLERRMFLAAWISTSLPLVSLTALGSAALVLFLRSLGLGGYQLSSGLMLSLALAGALLLVYRRRDRLPSAVNLLDEAYGFGTRLVAACEGGASFPPRPAVVRRVLRPHVTPWGLPLAALLLLVVACRCPLPALIGSEIGLAKAEPLAWKEMAEQLKALSAAELVEPEALKDWEERLQELRALPESDRFGHSALEAADRMNEELRSDTQALATALAEAGATLALAEKQSSAAAAQALREKAATNLARQSGGRLPLNKEFKESLCKKSSGKCSSGLCQSKAGKLAQACGGKLPKLGKAGEGEGVAETPPGVGSPDRGPGSVPLGLRDQEANLGTKREERVASDETENSEPGELVKIELSRPEVEPAAPIAPAGAARSESRDSGRSGRDILTPEETRLLHKFFR